MEQIELRKVKQGDHFKRKPNAKKEYIREQYNRRELPANQRQHFHNRGSLYLIRCSDIDNISRFIQLKPSTIVYQ